MQRQRMLSGCSVAVQCTRGECAVEWQIHLRVSVGWECQSVVDEVSRPHTISLRLKRMVRLMVSGCAGGVTLSVSRCLDSSVGDIVQHLADVTAGQSAGRSASGRCSRDAGLVLLTAAQRVEHLSDALAHAARRARSSAQTSAGYGRSRGQSCALQLGSHGCAEDLALHAGVGARAQNSVGAVCRETTRTAEGGKDG